MSGLLERFDAAPRALWLSAAHYGARLLANGNAPWLDTGACVAWQRKLMGLLKPDVAELPVAAVVAAWLGAHPELKAAMAAKSRTGFPLRSLLADEPLRAHLLDLVVALHAALAAPLVLVVPAPRAWLVLSYGQAHGSAPEIEDDDIDAAAVLIADFLRSFGAAGIAGVLLDETVAGDISPVKVELTQPVLNVAGHYHWPCGLRLAPGQTVDDAAKFDFTIAAEALPGSHAGIELAPDYWRDPAAASVPAGAFIHAAIPADAEPERVLDGIARLRATQGS